MHAITGPLGIIGTDETITLEELEVAVSEISTRKLDIGWGPKAGESQLTVTAIDWQIGAPLAEASTFVRLLKKLAAEAR